jgi:hypothetical protein
MTSKEKSIGDVAGQEADATRVRLFDRDAVIAITGVRVFDVGQGDCIGLLDQDGQVFCYVDYGGLVDHPDIHQPQNTAARLPLAYRDGRVSIILTHWDKDHYWSACKKNPEAQKCEWLVPRQRASPQAVLFAAGLEKASCWPEQRRDRPARIGIGSQYDLEIRKCAPFSRRRRNEDRNKTGLAVTLLRWENAAIDRFMILPGDCPFHLIPERPDAPICGLLAYHHGAKAHWTKATDLALLSFHSNRAMAYSCGRNDYGHPYRANYRPSWDEKALTTPDARHQSQSFIDLKW